MSEESDEPIQYCEACRYELRLCKCIPYEHSNDEGTAAAIAEKQEIIENLHQILGKKRMEIRQLKSQLDELRKEKKQ